MHSKPKSFQFLRNLFRPGNGTAWKIATPFPDDKREANQASLLQLLDVIYRERLEPAPMIFALAKEHRGMYRQKLRWLGQLLSRSTPLVEALEQVPGALPEESVLALRLGTQSGTLPETMEMLLQTQSDSAKVQKFDWNGLTVYWWSVGATLLIYLAFMRYFIAPTFKKMYEEMEMGREPFGQTLSEITPAAILLLIFTSLLVLLGCSRWIRNVLRTRILPYRGSWSTQSATSAILRMLAVNTASGKPIAGALSTLAKYHTHPIVRQRLLLARNEVEQGADPWNGLKVAKLLSAKEVEAVLAASGNTSKAWVLRQLSRVKEQQKLDLSDRMGTWVHPILALAFGCLVGWMAYSLFGSLYGMVTRFA